VLFFSFWKDLNFVAFLLLGLLFGGCYIIDRMMFFLLVELRTGCVCTPVILTQFCHANPESKSKTRNKKEEKGGKKENMGGRATNERGQ
jgi:hypothetical protein